MKNIKKAISMTMAAAMAVSMMGMLTAAEEVTEEAAEYSTIEEYIEYAIPHYVRAQSVEIDGTFYYSNTIDIYDINDIESGSIGEYVFLFDDDEIVGKMQVWQVDGEYASVFDTYITDEIQSSFDGGYDIAFGYFEDDLYSYDEVAGSAFVDGAGFEECPDYELPLNKSISKAASMDLAAIPAPFAAGTSLNVPHVHNTVCGYGHSEHGLCWAACVAMMVNYRDSKSLSALTVWNAMKTSADSDPVGTVSTINGAFDKYNYSHSSYSKSISASEVLGALSSDKPVFMSIEGTKNSGGDIAHAVVICGISIENATSTSANITYTINDPERWDLKSILVKADPSKAISTISYSLTNSTYNQWKRTYY